MDKQAKTVNIIITDATKVNGQHLAVGDVLTEVEADLAKELAGAGRARLATDEEVAAAAAAAEAAAKLAAKASK